MTCDAARELLLEADLRAVEPALQAHLDGCADCRALVEHLRAAERRLAGDIARLTPPTNSVLAVQRAAADSRRRRRVRRGMGISTLAAAAGLAAVFFATRQPALPGVVPVVAAHVPLTVSAPPGRNVAVLHTDNPDVVVFWFF